ncbi:UPF0223 family protein [Isobaculum melis]|uniref:Uncharacterized protein YktA, UPF0223 family n=1 Tax=Isobaculum melis TaxID=142588 RepID=A0A1H9RU42_9LACT|nr:UPF0223 family protein [Isobaculum melis]SER76322.1 Uncharacterized protein YktA, UPF0223 family [Isobaculum melis]
MENYSYPLDFSWSKEEMLTVISMWNAVETAYEKGISKEAFLSAYRAFKKVVPSIGEEKRLGKDFEAVSGFSLYRVVQASKTEKAKIVM